MTFFYGSRYGEATASLQKALDLNPRLWIAYLFRGNIQLEKKDYAGAVAAFSKARGFSSNGSQPVSMLAYAVARTGDTGKARGLLEELQATSAQRYLPPFNVAVAYLGLGERENCFTWLEKACDERDVRLFFLRVDKKWDPIRSDPRFQSVLKRIAL